LIKKLLTDTYEIETSGCKEIDVCISQVSPAKIKKRKMEVQQENIERLFLIGDSLKPPFSSKNDGSSDSRDLKNTSRVAIPNLFREQGRNNKDFTEFESLFTDF